MSKPVWYTKECGEGALVWKSCKSIAGHDKRHGLADLTRFNNKHMNSRDGARQSHIKLCIRLKQHAGSAQEKRVTQPVAKAKSQTQQNHHTEWNIPAESPAAAQVCQQMSAFDAGSAHQLALEGLLQLTSPLTARSCLHWSTSAECMSPPACSPASAMVSFNRLTNCFHCRMSLTASTGRLVAADTFTGSQEVSSLTGLD